MYFIIDVFDDNRYDSVTLVADWYCRECCGCHGTASAANCTEANLKAWTGIRYLKPLAASGVTFLFELGVITIVDTYRIA